MTEFLIEAVPIWLMVGIVGFMLSYTYHRRKAGKPVESKWASRKFIIGTVAVVYTILASFGLDIPKEQTIIVDSIAGLYVAIQGYLDSLSAKKDEKWEVLPNE